MIPLEPLQIPMLNGRIAIAAVALSHTLFATFIVGAAMIGAVAETLGFFTRKERYDRLAYLIAFTLILTTATVSFMGVVLVFFLNIFWPRFWSTLFRIMFWPILLEAIFFLGEAIAAYAWYYTWQWGASGARKRIHLMFGWLAAVFSLVAMVMIDIVASYMLTPRPPESFWGKIFNPTMVHLDLHRFFGNLTWTGFALAGLLAIGFLRAKGEEDQAFYRWAGRFCFIIGFSALLVMPVIGYEYLLQIRYVEPQVFHTLMLGEKSWLFDWVALLYGLLIWIGSFYIARTLRSSQTRPLSFETFMPVSLFLLGAAAIVFALPYQVQHIPFVRFITRQQINPWGKMQPNKYIAIAFLVVFGFFNLIYFLRSIWKKGDWKGQESADRLAPSLLIGLSFISILMMLGMGYVRETARASNGYLIYGEIRLSDERATYERSPVGPGRD